MVGEYTNSLAVIDEALKIHPDHPDALNNKAIALYLFGKVNNIDAADNALEILRKISIKNPSFGDPLYNMASIQSERGRNAAATESWKKFLKIESTGVYVQVAKGRLGIKSDEKVLLEKRSKMESPIKLGDIKGEAEKTLQGMKKKEFAMGEFNGEVYEGKGIKVLTIDRTVEIVEKEIDKPTNLSEFNKTHGEPLKRIKNLYGITLVYGDFAVDVFDGKVKKVIYFKREVI
jgi:hypothetical protein